MICWTSRGVEPTSGVGVVLTSPLASSKLSPELSSFFFMKKKDDNSGDNFDDASGDVNTTPTPDVGSTPLDVQQIICDAAVAHGVEPALMLAIAKKESSFNPANINPSDPSYGLFQIQTFWLKY